ncbi:MAG: hypothetical protein ACTHMG_01715 [Sphingomonas sp.]
MLLVALALSHAQPETCLASGTRGTTVAGQIGVSTARGDPAHGIPAYRYVTLTLDSPICVRGDHAGDWQRVRVLELIGKPPNQTLPFRFKGQHARVTGRIQLARKDAPEAALLEDPTIAADAE